MIYKYPNSVIVAVLYQYNFFVVEVQNSINIEDLIALDAAFVVLVVGLVVVVLLLLVDEKFVEGEGNNFSFDFDFLVHVQIARVLL